VPAIYRVDWRARLLLGMVLLMGAALNHDAPFALLHIILASLLIAHIARTLAPLWSAARLLRWLVIPILLLHMLLTPGAIIAPSLPLPVSREGVGQGLWLSLHLVEMFVAAMALSRLLSWREWLKWLSGWPGVGERLGVDARLFLLMQRDARLLIEKQRRLWREERPDLIRLARLLAETLMQMLERSELLAERLWRGWHSRRLQALFVGDATDCSYGPMTWGVGVLTALLLGRLVYSLIQWIA